MECLPASGRDTQHAQQERQLHDEAQGQAHIAALPRWHLLRMQQLLAAPRDLGLLALGERGIVVLERG